jgi:hypothetical protein
MCLRVCYKKKIWNFFCCFRKVTSWIRILTKMSQITQHRLKVFLILISLSPRSSDELGNMSGLHPRSGS